MSPYCLFMFSATTCASEKTTVYFIVSSHADSSGNCLPSLCVRQKTFWLKCGCKKAQKRIQKLLHNFSIRNFSFPYLSSTESANCEMKIVSFRFYLLQMVVLSCALYYSSHKSLHLCGCNMGADQKVHRFGKGGS